MSIATSDLVFQAGAVKRPLVVRRHAQARAMRLSIDPYRGEVRLTLPPGAPIRPAIAWATTKRAWIEARLAKVPERRMLAAGATVPFDGIERAIDWQAGALRKVKLDGSRLVVGGPVEGVARRIGGWLRTEALAMLTAETRAVALHAGVEVSEVRVGDPRGRWGSCTGAGAIRYSWRLVMAPAAVRESVIAHEVAHRLHMNHSPSFHAAVAALLGREPTAERRWLRANGCGLHAFEA